MDAQFRVGDTIAVHQKIIEGDPSAHSVNSGQAGSGQVKTRIQIFEGIVISINNRAGTFLVRKISDGVGVEKIWPKDSPMIEKIVVKRKAKKIRRAKLFYLRDLTPKQAAKIVS